MPSPTSFRAGLSIEGTAKVHLGPRREERPSWRHPARRMTRRTCPSLSILRAGEGTVTTQWMNTAGACRDLPSHTEGIGRLGSPPQPLEAGLRASRPLPRHRPRYSLEQLSTGARRGSWAKVGAGIWAWSGVAEHATAEERDRGAAIALVLERLEPVDGPPGLAPAPGERHGRLDRVAVAPYLAGDGA